MTATKDRTPFILHPCKPIISLPQQPVLHIRPLRVKRVPLPLHPHFGVFGRRLVLVQTQLRSLARHLLHLPDHFLDAAQFFASTLHDLEVGALGVHFEQFDGNVFGDEV